MSDSTKSIIKNFIGWDKVFELSQCRQTNQNYSELRSSRVVDVTIVLKQTILITDIMCDNKEIMIANGTTIYDLFIHLVTCTATFRIGKQKYYISLMGAGDINIFVKLVD